MRDIASNIGVVSALAPAAQAATVNGVAIDRKGFEKVAFVVSTGAIAGDGEFTFKVQDSDDGTAFADVNAQWIVGEAPAKLEANTAYRLGYWGHKRYSRVVLSKTSGTSIVAGAVAVLAGANDRPVA